MTDISDIIEALTNVRERVIIVEVRSQANDERVAALTEEVTWLRRTLVGIMISLLLMVATAALGAVITL